MTINEFLYLWSYINYYEWPTLFNQWCLAKQIHHHNETDEEIQTAIIGNSLNLKKENNIFSKRKTFLKKLQDKFKFSFQEEKIDKSKKINEFDTPKELKKKNKILEFISKL